MSTAARITVIVCIVILVGCTWAQIFRTISQTRRADRWKSLAMQFAYDAAISGHGVACELRKCDRCDTYDAYLAELHREDGGA